jgi:hypothetical protein
MKSQTKWALGLGAAAAGFLWLLHEHNDQQPQIVNFTMMAGQWSRSLPTGSAITLIAAPGFSPPVMTQGNLVLSGSDPTTGSMTYTQPVGGSAIFTSINPTTGQSSTLTITN